MTTPSPDPLFTANRRRTTRVFSTFFALLAFLVLAIVGLFTSTGQALDQMVLDVAMTGQGRVAPAAQAITQSVTTVTVGGAALVAMLIAAFRGRFALAARAGVLVLGANLMAQALKGFIISRPYMGIGLDLPNSFPSGHTTVLVSLVLALVIVTPYPARTWLAVLGSVVASAAIIVIVVAGWHRPSDIIGGILVAFMWAMTLAPQEEPSPYSDPLNTTSIALSATALVGLAILFAVFYAPLSAVADEIIAGTPVTQIMAQHRLLALTYATGACLALISLTTLCIHLVAYLQTGRHQWAGR